jgi:hypothetical protein
VDGEAGFCGPDAVVVFDALHRRHKASDAILYAFDMMALDGAALRPNARSLELGITQGVGRRSKNW